MERKVGILPEIAQNIDWQVYRGAMAPTAEQSVGRFAAGLTAVNIR
ncbi:MAG: hypothetical protein WDZ63_05025 [Burkholderiales bacterium]